MASGGYPSAFEAGKPIFGIEEADRIYGVKVFHAGTNRRDSTYYTSGGRVLGVSARGSDLPDAVERAYDAVMKIRFDGMHYRKDIAARGLRHLRERK
jgi:phosphoribosylamine--glycine ligase